METLVCSGALLFRHRWDRTLSPFEGHLATFVPLPILDFYFDKLLAELDRRGIEVRFIAMPVNRGDMGRSPARGARPVRGLSGGLRSALHALPRRC